jgi:TolB-like protein
LLTHVWAGVIVSSDSVYQAVASLRRVLGDDPKRPRYIANVPRLGYRMVATVAPWQDPPVASAPTTRAPERAPPTSATNVRVASPSWLGARVAWGAGTALSLALAGALWFLGGTRDANDHASASATQVPQRSIAVLPFLDLTEEMDEEPFADGMTEELINRLSQTPGFRVPNLRSSFYFKGRQLPVAVIAESLGVAYVLDGSVRKAGARVRVAARLVRADDGYVAWAETYDRPFDDILMVQDEIAGVVTEKLTATIGK